MADVTTILNAFHSHIKPIPLRKQCIHYSAVFMKEENFILCIHYGTTENIFNNKTA